MQLKQFTVILLASAIVVINPATIFAATSASVHPFQTGTYSKAESGADTLNVEGNVKITEQSSSPELSGQVDMGDTSVTWHGRVADQAVFYTVVGNYVAGGGNDTTGIGPETWAAWYTDGNPYVVIDVNAPGKTDDYVWYGTDGATVTIRLLNGTPGATYNVSLYSSGAPGVIGVSAVPTLSTTNAVWTGYLSGVTVGGAILCAQPPTTSSGPAATGPAPTTAPVIQAQITDVNGNVLTGAQTVFVGQKITLKGKVTPANVQVTAHQWTIGGTPIKGYVTTTDAGTKTSLAAADLASDTVAFYWIAGAQSVSVTYRATVGTLKKPGEASVQYVVKRPSAGLTSKTTPLNPPITIVGQLLSFGSRWPGNDGITSTGWAIPGAGGTGQVAFVQLVKADRRYTADDANSSKFKLTGSDAFIVDDTGGTMAYGSPINVAEKGIAYSIFDTPGQNMPNMKKYSADDTFKTYFMYKPAGADSIWVTLCRLDWFWKASATKGNNGWTLDAGSASSADPPGNPAGTDSTELPIWTGKFSAQTFVADN